jgi:serine/threonine protein kinase
MAPSLKPKIAAGQLVIMKLSRRVDVMNAQGKHFLENPLSEVAFLKELSSTNGGAGHPNVIRLLDFYQDAKHYCTVLPFCERADFYEYVMNRGKLLEQEARVYFAQLLSGVRFIHLHNICHLDLSLENLLVDRRGNLVICDFGVARKMKSALKAAGGGDENKKTKSKTTKTAAAAANQSTFEPFSANRQANPGKLRFMAAEVFAGRDFHGDLADVWSIGIVLFYMLFGVLPFELPGSSDKRFQMIYDGRIRAYLRQTKSLSSTRVSESAIDMLACMLCPANQRLNTAALLKHPWLAAAPKKPKSNKKKKFKKKKKKRSNKYTNK